MKDIISSSNEYHLYIGIPFCHTKCSYCHYIDNLKFGNKNVNDSYFNLLLQQLKLVLYLNRNKILKSVYFGGGTPSLLSYSQVLDIKNIFFAYKVSPVEITIEIHPSTWNFSFLDLNFFTRYSIGVQAINHKILYDYKRNSYDWSSVLKIITDIKESNINTYINLDFVFDQIFKRNDIDLINQLSNDKLLSPDSIVFYPNTKGRGKERSKNIYKTLNFIASSLKNYTNLHTSNHIFIKNGKERFSTYSENQYELLNDIIGIGHYSISEIGNESYLGIYNENNNTFFYKKRHNDRYLKSLIEASTGGARLNTINKVNNELINFFTKKNNLYYLKNKNYLVFYNYLLEHYSLTEANLFVSVINYGDSNIDSFYH